LPILFPHDKGTQGRIADFLDWKTTQIDALIAKKRALIERLKEKRLAVITQAVTKGLAPDTSLRNSCIPWLASIPVNWKTPPLSYRYSVELGKMLDEKRITRDALVPYLRNVDVQWDSINFDDLPEMDISEAEYDRYTVASGDILVCEGGEVGRCAIVHETRSVIGFQKALHRLRPLTSDEDPRFMYYSLFWAASSGIFNIESASTIAHLTAEQLRRYRLPQPSFGEQQEIARFLDQQQGKWSRLLLKAAEVIERLLEYRSALITAAVTGKLDVPRHDIHATA
jgi:type I restriction enzyme S subunit